MPANTGWNWDNEITRGKGVLAMSKGRGRSADALVGVDGVKGADPVARYLDGLAPGSRRTLGQALDRIAAILTRGRAGADTLAWHRLRPRHMVALREQLKQGYSAATTNKMLSAFRGVMREAMGLGMLDEKDFARMAALPSVKNQRVPTGRTLTPVELRALFRACARGGPASCRDAALLALLYGGGLRRSEAVALDVADFEMRSGLLRVAATEGRARVVRATGSTRAAIHAWLAVRGRARGALLCPVDKAGRVVVRHMTDQAVLYIVRRLAVDAGIKRFSPHDLRRSYFFKMRRAGGRGRKRRDAGGATAGMAGTRERPGTMLGVPFQGCQPPR